MANLPQTNALPKSREGSVLCRSILITTSNPFKGRHFPGDVIVLCVVPIMTNLECAATKNQGLDLGRLCQDGVSTAVRYGVNRVTQHREWHKGSRKVFAIDGRHLKSSPVKAKRRDDRSRWAETNVCAMDIKTPPESGYAPMAAGWCL
jgi:hypothetical protein